MKKDKKVFTVLVEETLSRMVEVEALDETSAVSLVQEMYDNEEIVLDADDHSDSTIEIPWI